MTREIKFRWYDTDEGRMLYRNEVDQSDDLYVGITEEGIRIYKQEGYGIVEKSYPAMQYTGLKDKNGKEIYEGDILATENDGKDGCDTWDRIIMGYVYSDNRFGCRKHRIALGDDEDIYSNKYVEVIGNVYEHPHLLSSTDK